MQNCFSLVPMLSRKSCPPTCVGSWFDHFVVLHLSVSVPRHERPTEDSNSSTTGPSCIWPTPSIAASYLKILDRHFAVIFSIFHGVLTSFKDELNSECSLSVVNVIVIRDADHLRRCQWQVRAFPVPVAKVKGVQTKRQRDRCQWILLCQQLRARHWNEVPNDWVASCASFQQCSMGSCPPLWSLHESEM